jgi:hypothetical protein
MTMSREHLLLEPKGASGWAVKVLSGAGAVVDGHELEQGAARTLAPGSAMRLGDVVLSFWDPAGLQQRLMPRGP